VVPNPEGAPSKEALPKLTIGQRVLAALPNLQREKPSPTANGAELVRPDAVIEPGVTGSTGSRLRDAFLKPAPAPAAKTSSGTGGTRADPYPDQSTEELRRSMKYLDDRERRVALFIGPLLAALDLALMQVTLHDNPAVGHKNHADPSTIVALGVGSAVLAVVVLVAAYYRRRSFTIFALLFAGYGGGIVTMIPSWIVAGWLFIHFNRIQKVVVSRTGGPAAARQRAAQARADRNGSGRPRLGSRRDKTPPVPAGPEKNKRYTPPKAPGGR
jgi:hypothetical protein